MSIEQRLEAATVKAESASEIARQWANGPEYTEIPTESGPLPTLAEFMRENNEAVQGAINAGKLVVPVSSIKALPATALVNNRLYYVSSFHDGWAAVNARPVGGGNFVWDANRSKADHNGGTIIAPEAIAAWNGTQTDLPTLLNWTGAGIGCFVRETADAVYPEHFGLFGGGVADDTVAMRAAFKVLQTSSASKIKFQGKKDVLITDKVLLRADDKTIDGTGIRIMLGSSQAGMQFAGDRNKIIGFRGEQTNQSHTPTLIYIFNDATTKRSSFCKVIGVTGYSLYRGIHMYMGDNSSGAACYRHSLYDCEFINQYQQKTWAGSFGISFDGPFDGDAAGNDSKCVNCLTSGYERNYVINNSIATQFVTCSGDGALYCFYYGGAASGLRIVGGYYEYNTHLIGVNGAKYDAYLLYPSVSNTISTQITGDEIGYISGGWAVGLAATTPISNGAFTTNNEIGTSEVYSVNGHTIYSGVSKVARATLTSSGDWIFNPVTSFSVSGLMNVDTIRGYTGGAVPVRIVNTSGSAGAKLVFGTNSIDRVEVSYEGNFRPTTDGGAALGDESHKFSTIHAETGAISTSDERNKTDFTAISEAERAVALEIKRSIYKFKFIESVNAKGDKARIHFGVGAQTVRDIFEKHGLNGFDYAVLCHDEWDDLVVNIPEEKDERGNIVKEAETKTLQTAGDRFGIRYEQLSMFILASI